MAPAIDLIQALTNSDLAPNKKREFADSFSREFGWRPHDLLDAPNSLPAVNLIVEQGLDNAAMLSFLPSNRRSRDIQETEQRRILGLSYNSLVDWHIWIDQESIRCFYNRFDPPAAVYTHNYCESDYSALDRRVFDEAVGRAPNPNLLALDGALLGTISTWKEILHLEVPSATGAISALFNAIILARAVEDFDARLGKVVASPSLLQRVKVPGAIIGDAIDQLILERTRSNVSSRLFDKATLEPFSLLSTSSRIRLIEAFYRHEAIPYDYDFSVMSKYALSRLYERYMSVMRDDASVQLQMFSLVPEEEWNRQLGGVYTPQYIARNTLNKPHAVHSIVECETENSRCLG